MKGRLSISSGVLSLLLAASTMSRAQEPVPAPALATTNTSEAANATATEAATTSALDEVDQRARIVERRLDLLEEEAARQKAATPVVGAGTTGFNFKSADGAFLVKIRGLIQADGRQFVDDHDLQVRDSFLIRRARPLLEATFFDVADFRLMPDFGNGQALVQDAYIDVRPFTFLELRGGKFKPPLSLERLQSAAAVVFPERGFPTGLAPSRDLGFMLHGVLGAAQISYEVGVFNGVADGGSGDLDNNHAKDFAGRIFLQPWNSDPYSLLANFGVGVSGSSGWQRGTAAVFQTSGMTTRRTAAPVPGLPVYRTPGQQTFFSYRINEDVPDGAVIGHGRHDRLEPQGYFYYGPLGLLGEYIVSRQAVEIGSSAASLTHAAWQLAACYVFGGKPLYEGTTITQPFDPRKGSWGALELAARYNDLRIDGDAFPTFADPDRSARRARALGAVASWHWSRNIKLSLSYEHTRFRGGAASGADRKPENILFQRIQAAF